MMVDTAFERGWQRLKNGELLTEAERAGYNIFITTDQNLKYQQSLANRKISIIVLNTTSWPRIRTQTSLVVDAVNRAKENSFDEISFST